MAEESFAFIIMCICKHKAVQYSKPNIFFFLKKE